MLKKIVFMGTPSFAVPILKSLYQNGYPVSVVYTQPPQKSQRGQKINKSPIQGISETLKIECRIPSSLKNNIEEYNYLKELDADLAIVVAYGQIIPKEYLSLVKKGFINIHASLLPKWRGAAPIQRSIINLEKETGISAFKYTDQHFTDFDAVIATGSNNSARYFNHYFGKYPNIIRKNRNGIAILNGQETKSQMEGLATDIIQYYGLG